MALYRRQRFRDELVADEHAEQASMVVWNFHVDDDAHSCLFHDSRR